MIFTANIVNLYAETGANMISDDTTPALTLQSTTNVGGEVRGLVAVSTASVDILNTTRIDSASATVPVLVRQTAVGNMSIGVLQIQGNSVASGAVLEFTNKGFQSITSVVLTSVANTDYAIRVAVGNQVRWIPLFKDAAIIGGAAFT